MIRFYHKYVTLFHNETRVADYKITIKTEWVARDKVLELTWDNVDDIAESDIMKPFKNPPFTVYEGSHKKRFIEFSNVSVREWLFNKDLRNISEKRTPNLNMRLKIHYEVWNPSLRKAMKYLTVKDAEKFFDENFKKLLDK